MSSQNGNERVHVRVFILTCEYLLLLEIVKVNAINTFHDK